MNGMVRRPLAGARFNEGRREGLKILDPRLEDARFTGLRKGASISTATIHTLSGKRLGMALLLHKEGETRIVMDGAIDTEGRNIILDKGGKGKKSLVALAERPSALRLAEGKVSQLEKMVIIGGKMPSGESYSYTVLKIESSFSIVEDEEAVRESLQITKPVTVRMGNGDEKVLSMAQLLGTEGWKMKELEVMGKKAVLLMGEDRNVFAIRGSGSMAALVDTDKSLFMLKNLPSGRHFAVTMDGKWYDAVPASHRLAKLILDKYGS